MDIEKLKEPLNPAFVSQRSQGNQQLSYIEGWHAIAEANRIFGFDGWNRETVYCEQVSEHEYEKNGNQMHKIGYCAKVKITVIHESKHFDEELDSHYTKREAIVREGTGYGSGISKDLGDAHEGASKEAETDAMKRALMTFGNPFGLALYDKTQKDVRQTVGNTPIREAYVQRAADVWRECVEADTDEPDYAKMQEVNDLLTPDEQIAVLNTFGKQKMGTRQIKNIINDCLRMEFYDGSWQKPQ